MTTLLLHHALESGETLSPHLRFYLVYCPQKKANPISDPPPADRECDVAAVYKSAAFDVPIRRWLVPCRSRLALESCRLSLTVARRNEPIYRFGLCTSWWVDFQLLTARLNSHFPC
jgi:hypothetical protein